VTALRHVQVPIPGRSYEVVVGPGAAEFVGKLIPASARRAAVVTQEGLPLSVTANIPHEQFVVGHGEQHKTLATVEQLCRDFAGMGLTRDDVVIAVGGGMVTDIAGFAASCYHRGVPVLYVATTLLAMVDAAVGGKTGVNLPEGKNLVGAYWQPVGVVCDIDALDALPDREVRCGLGEMAKYHFLTGDDLLALDLTDRIARCVEIKADVVASDEREDGRRALLNYGHTLAHALETETDHTLAHGEAVDVGMMFAAHLANVLGRIDVGRVDEHFHVVAEAYGLATDLPAGVEPQRLVTLMRRDKKARSGLTFVLDGPDGLEVVAGVDDRPVLEALARMAP